MNFLANAAKAAAFILLTRIGTIVGAGIGGAALTVDAQTAIIGVATTIGGLVADALFPVALGQ